MPFNTQLYDVNYAGVVSNVAPPNHRTPVLLALLNAFASPVQWLHDLNFEDYAYGCNYPNWNNTATYNIGARVINGIVYDQVNTFTYFGDNAVYEAIAPVPVNTPPPNATYWYKRQNCYIGVRERINYNAQIITLSYVLNKWFNVTNQWEYFYIANQQVYNTTFWMSDNNTSSYMSNNADTRAYMGKISYPFEQYNFIVYVADSVFSAIQVKLHNNRNNVIYYLESIINKYNVAGKLYTIQTYANVVPGGGGSSGGGSESS